MSNIEPDPKVVQEIALEALRVAIAQRRDVAVGAAIYDRFDRPMLSQDSFRAWHDAACVEYDRLAAALPIADEQQGKPCPCGCPVVDDMCSCPTPCPCEPDCGFCMVPNPLRNATLDEWIEAAHRRRPGFDDDTRAVAAVLDTVGLPTELDEPLAALRERFADRIAELKARDVKVGE